MKLAHVYLGDPYQTTARFYTCEAYDADEIHPAEARRSSSLPHYQHRGQGEVAFK